MTPQEIFEKVAKHLFAQGERALNAGGYRCAYRGENGTSCAVGCLIDNTHYNPRMDSVTEPGTGAVDDVLLMGFDEIAPGLRISEHQNLLNALQSVHDRQDSWHDEACMCDELQSVADSHDLNAKFIYELAFNRPTGEIAA